VVFAFGFLIFSASAQDSTTTTTTTTTTKKLPTIGQTEPEPEVVKLSPYTIKDDQVVGWNSQMTFSGSRTAENIMTTPVGITIITKDLLKDMGATNMTQILQYTGSGITPRVGYRDDYVVRGFRQENMRDGILGSFITAALLYDIDRVEFVKGPTALVFSNYGNVSGTANYVTKRPSAKESGDASVTFGNYGLYIGEATQRGPLNASGTKRYRFTIGAQEYRGWAGRATPGDNNYHNNNLVSGSYDWDVLPKLQLRFDLRHVLQKDRDHDSAMIDPLTGLVWQKIVDGYNTTTSWTNLRSEEITAQFTAILQVTSEFDIRASAVSSVGDYQYHEPTRNGAGGLQAADGPNYTLITGMRQRDYHNWIENVDTNIDATWSHTFSNWFRNRFNFGWANRQSHSRTDYYQTSPLPDFVIADPVGARPKPFPQQLQTPASVGASRQSGYTYYVHDALYFLDEKLIVTGGARFITPGSNGLAKRDYVPNVGLVYRFTPGLSFYAAYAESVQLITGVDQWGTAYVNQYGKSKDVGLKFNLFNEHLFGSVAAFDIFQSPVFLTVTKPHPVTGVIITAQAQQGNLSNKGMEADIGYTDKVGPGEWSVYVTFYNGDPRNELGLQPAAAYKTKDTIFMKYRLSTGSMAGLYFGGGWSHVGSSPGSGFPTIPAYSYSSLLAGYGIGNWSVTGNIDNLADKKDIILGTEGRNDTYLMAPRTYKVSFNYKW
jgi:iron complex outermembrane receptor protein